MKSFLVILLLLNSIDLISQRSITSAAFDISSDKNRFNVALTQDTVLRSSLSYYNPGTGGGVASVFRCFMGDSLLGPNSLPNADHLYPNEVKFLNDRGYFLFSDTLPSGLNSYPNDRVLDFIDYGKNERKWRVKGYLRVIGRKRGLTVKKTNSTWLVDYRKESFIKLSLSSGDTLAILTFNSFSNQFGSYSIDLLPQTLDAVDSNSDTLVFSVLAQLRDSLGRPTSESAFIVGSMTLYGLEVSNFTLLKNPSGIRFSQGHFGYFLNKDSFNEAGFFRRDIYAMSILGDTLLKFPPIERLLSLDTLLQARRSTFFRILKRENRYFYIESYKDTFWSRTEGVNHLRIIKFEGEAKKYDHTLRDSISGYYDLNFRDADINHKGELILSVGDKYDGAQARLLAVTDNGCNYYYCPRETNNEDLVQVYPTVTSSFVAVESTRIIDSYKLLDSMGRVILNGTPFKKSTQVDLSGVNQGFLTLYIFTGDSWRCFKVFKR